MWARGFATSVSCEHVCSQLHMKSSTSGEAGQMADGSDASLAVSVAALQLRSRFVARRCASRLLHIILISCACICLLAPSDHSSPPRIDDGLPMRRFDIQWMDGQILSSERRDWDREVARAYKSII